MISMSTRTIAASRLGEAADLLMAELRTIEDKDAYQKQLDFIAVISKLARSAVPMMSLA